MIPNFFRKLKISKARKAREAAYLSLQQAKARGDTRDQHKATERLYMATTAQMMAEVGR